MTLGRRRWTIGAAGLLAGCVTPLRYEAPERVEAAPFRLGPSECVSPTPEVAEGPFYQPDTPRTRYLGVPGDDGRFVLEGRVLGPGCEPIEGAVLDFWQADASGRYDIDGQRFRGHQFSMRGGLYRLCTVRPGPETVVGVTRTPHLHVKAQAPGGRLLTTQLFFADEARRNADDLFFDPGCVLSLDDGGVMPRARFDLVLRSA